MLAIVVTLGGYFAGLHWLVSPPDPWQANPKMAQSHATPAKKRVAAVKPVEPAEAEAPVASTQTKAPETALAVEAPAAVEPAMLPAADKRIENAMARQTERPAAAPARPAQSARTAHTAHSDASKTRTPVHKRVALARNSERRLEMMVLRTYERPDGTRFTRLLPMSSARSAMALQLDDDW